MCRLDPRSLTTMLFVAALCSAPALGGAGELSLDRDAIRGLLHAALPPPAELSVAGLPPLSVSLDRPRQVAFVEGGVEATLDVALDALDYRGPVRARYVPEVTRPDGVVILRPESVTPAFDLPVAPDLSPLLPAVPLPRALSWTVPGPGGRDLELVCVVHGIEVENERLVVRFGLLARGIPLPTHGNSR